MTRKLFVFLIFNSSFLITYAQHPNGFKYDIDKKEYSITGDEKKAVKNSVNAWFASHDSVGSLVKMNAVFFSPDYRTLPVCDSIAQEMSYHHAKFNGFPAGNNGGFYGVDIVMKNKQGEEEKYRVDVSYSFIVVRIWFQDKVLFKVNQ